MADDTLLVDEATRVQELVRRCAVSRDWRRTQGDHLRALYERGVESGPRALYNLFRAHIDRVGSYLFAPGTARFGTHLPASDRAQWLEAADTARDEFRETWADSDTELTVLQLIEWGLVYGATLAKVQADPATGFRTGYIQPWDFGVSREDVPALDEQDTLAHWYSLSIPQVERWVQGKPRAESLLAIAREHASTGRAGGPKEGLVVSNIAGTFPASQTITGGFPGDPDTLADVQAASVDEPTVEFVDCWERRNYRKKTLIRERAEVFEDWQVTTMLADAQVLFVQRRNPDLPRTRTGTQLILPGELPFVPMVPRPLPDYFWGRSELTTLRNLQGWLDEILREAKKNIALQLDPAKFISGVADWEEAVRAMSTPGGGYGSQDPGAKMDQLRLAIGEEVFKVIQLIREFFGDASGTPEVLTEPGSTPGGVRSMGHFQMAAGIGAGRIRRMALIIEDPLGQIATKGFRLLQRHDEHVYTTQRGQRFLLSELPAALTFRVDAHTAAPIFAEQTQAKALILQRAGAIGGEDLIEAIDMPGKDALKPKAREREAARAQHAEKMLEIQAAKALKTGGRTAK